MGKKHPKGICRICGREAKLTFEHVPPRATYNKSAVKYVSVMDMIKTKDAMPWELDKVHGNISQKGKGGYWLCEECNNNLGDWYARPYKKLIDGLMIVRQEIADDSYSSVELQFKDIQPLAIYKQILSMFCDINPNLSKQDGIRDFLLNTESQDMDTKKYKLCIYLQKSGIERTAPITAKITLGEREPVLLSEISSIPIGMILYIDLPEGIYAPATDISSFVSCKYSDKRNVTMALNIYENNTWIPEDFRSKEEIIATIKESESAMDNGMLSRPARSAARVLYFTVHAALNDRHIQLDWSNGVI